MDLAEQATMARRRGEHNRYHSLLVQSLKKEQEAAMLAVSQNAQEPTRSVLLKSAAHLAIDCNEHRLAEQLIGYGLAGNPPEEIAEELRSLFERVGFDRHLALHGVQLQDTDLQMVLLGSVIAPGMAASNEFVERIATMQRLVYRTSESDRHLPYRERGDPEQSVENAVQLFVSVPRPASFAVSLRVASEKQQGEFNFAESVQVIDHLLDRLGMFEREDMSGLRREIPQPEYFDNFVELASELAPDGKRVRLVGFTITRDGKEKQLQMKRATQGVTRGFDAVSTEPVRVRGRVFFFNAKDEDRPVIKLQAEDGTEWRLKVTPEQIQKTVMFAAKKRKVTVEATRVGKITLQVQALRAAHSRRKKHD